MGRISFLWSYAVCRRLPGVFFRRQLQSRMAKGCAVGSGEQNRRVCLCWRVRCHFRRLCWPCIQIIWRMGRSSRLGDALHLTKKRSPMPTKKPAKSGSHRNSGGNRKWSAAVTSDSTHPREGLFKKDAKTIARELASKKVSPKGPSSGMRMLTFYINRAGKNLPASRIKVLENAKKLLHERIATARDRDT